MKLFSIRILLNAAAALSLLASASSCTKVNIDNPDQAEQYIGFTSSVETKAPIESSVEMNEFAVWAAYYIDGNLDNELPMDEVRVYREDNLWLEGDWHFEAFYPHPSDLSATQAAVGKDALEINFTAPHDNSQITGTQLTINYYYGPSASHDLMTAKADRSYPAGGGNAVQFTFSHLLSRVSIAVKTTTDEVTLKSLTFGGMSVLGAYNTVHPGQWHLLTDFEDLSNVQSGSFSDLNDDIPSPLPSDGKSVDVLSDLLLIPQTPGDGVNGHALITVAVEYALGSNIETKTIALPSTTPWEPGRHYRYTLTLGGADVTLTVRVVEWDERNFSVEF